MGLSLTWGNTLSDPRIFVLSLGVFVVRFMYVFKIAHDTRYVPNVEVSLKKLLKSADRTSRLSFQFLNEMK